MKTDRITPDSSAGEMNVKIEIKQETPYSDYGFLEEVQFPSERTDDVDICCNNNVMSTKVELKEEPCWEEKPEVKYDPEDCSVSYLHVQDECGMSALKTAKQRKKWNPQSMIEAVNAVKEKKMGYLKASKVYNVPKSTLGDYVKHKTKDINALINMKLGRKCTLGDELEEELVRYCEIMESRYFGLRSSDIRQLAFQIAVRNNIHHSFPISKGTAGKKWQRNFLMRHPSLTLRTPQSVSLARAKGFSKERVNLFFDILKPELEKVNFNPAKVFSVDETGITVVQSRQFKIISVKGKKQVGRLSSQERGALMTMVSCMSAAGMFVPPLIVFPQKDMKSELLDGCPPGTIARCHPSGWIQLNMFTEWFHHFLEHTKPTPEDPIVLILDGYFSHTRNIDVIQLARQHGVIIVCLPPHTTHKLQPLEVAFIDPFKTYYSQAVESWMYHHAFRALTSYQMGEAMGKAYSKCATLEIAMKGFQSCGIIPFNRHVFAENEFLPLGNENDEEVGEPEGRNRPIQSNWSDTAGGPSSTSAAITSSPFKTALEERLQRNDKPSRPSKSRSLATSSSENVVPKASTAQHNRRKQNKRSHSSSSSSSEDFIPLVSTDEEDSADDECLYCRQPYRLDKCGEQWIRCINCLRWAHELCSAVEQKGWKSFVCEICQ